MGGKGDPLEWRGEPVRYDAGGYEGWLPLRYSNSELYFTVHPAGPSLTDDTPLTSYCSLDGELRKVSGPSLMIQQYRLGPAGGRVEFGEHRVAQELNQTGVAPRPLATVNNLRTWMVLSPPGPSIGPARGVPCYAGRDDEFARLTVAYPGSEPVDVYADRSHSRLSSE